MRERVEDLGRLTVLLDQIFSDDIFDKLGTRAKYACDQFFILNIEDQSALIHELAYALQNLKEKVSDCLVIAQGEDILNEVIT